MKVSASSYEPRTQKLGSVHRLLFTSDALLARFECLRLVLVVATFVPCTHVLSEDTPQHKPTAQKSAGHPTPAYVADLQGSYISHTDRTPPHSSSRPCLAKLTDIISSSSSSSCPRRTTISSNRGSSPHRALVSSETPCPATIICRRPCPTTVLPSFPGQQQQQQQL